MLEGGGTETRDGDEGDGFCYYNMEVRMRPANGRLRSLLKH